MLSELSARGVRKERNGGQVMQRCWPRSKGMLSGMSTVRQRKGRPTRTALAADTRRDAVVGANGRMS